MPGQTSNVTRALADSPCNALESHGDGNAVPEHQLNACRYTRVGCIHTGCRPLTCHQPQRVARQDRRLMSSILPSEGGRLETSQWPCGSTEMAVSDRDACCIRRRQHTGYQGLLCGTGSTLCPSESCRWQRRRAHHTLRPAARLARPLSARCTVTKLCSGSGVHGGQCGGTVRVAGRRWRVKSSDEQQHWSNVGFECARRVGAVCQCVAPGGLSLSQPAAFRTPVFWRAVQTPIIHAAQDPGLIMTV